ncbi:glycoside hydrolase family 2 TIM barrel-domain containing protein [Pseudohalioglobus lutimaris]|uniref:Beta-glucuronidase n=1 Tax=Pseudohalioglobus lutimaris TaxID=1737061 RepID=A0A2N5X6P4_9GAMM|nr:glycoside hydrolase family 2 TIM barrel-domain containing protein [Pseudohalioglobus lutimaris]PLW70157.1 beta-glucuronidase [Pseudohalioglobus lutimaris]
MLPIAVTLVSAVLLVACAAESPSYQSLAANDLCPVEAVADGGHEDNPLFTARVKVPEQPLAPLLGNVRSRSVTSLNGQWNYIVDQLGVGDASPLLRGGVGEDASYGAGELLEYSFAGGDTLQVPGDWNSQHAELFWYRGIVWYQRDFDYQLDDGRRLFLYFGGANFAKDVYVNGTLLARHKGGFTPFNTEITQYLRPGSNSVVVKVDSRSAPTEIPTEYNDWLNYGGITRDVMLVETPATFLGNYKLQLAKGSRERLQGWVQLQGARAGQAVRLRIPGADIDETFRVDARGRATVRLDASLKLWSPQEPHLYDVEWSIEGSVLKDHIGFRSIETRGEDILLNGEPVFLRGVSLHEESLLRPGRAHSAADAAAVIDRLKALNANFVRLAHYPHNEHMVRAADRAGILVWAELPVYHNITFDNPCTLGSAQKQYSELIARDQNRAAVILWSLGNETPETEARDAFFQSMAEHVRGQDDTRLLTAALLGFGGMEAVGEYIGTLIAAEHSKLVAFFTDPEPVTMTIEDPLGEVVDVIGYNEYLGWYMSGMITDALVERGLEVTEAQVRERMLTEMVKFTIDTDFGKPLVISEFGAGAKQGQRGGPLDVWSEDYQARVYQQQLAMLENSEALRGISPWILKDFRAPYRLNTDKQHYWNRKGLLSEEGREKLAFKLLSDYYAEHPGR